MDSHNSLTAYWLEFLKWIHFLQKITFRGHFDGFSRQKIHSITACVVQGRLWIGWKPSRYTIQGSTRCIITDIASTNLFQRLFFRQNQRNQCQEHLTRLWHILINYGIWLFARHILGDEDWPGRKLANARGKTRLLGLFLQSGNFVKMTAPHDFFASSQKNFINQFTSETSKFEILLKNSQSRKKLTNKIN